MVTKSICKEEAKRLKKFGEHTEDWASKVAGSLKSTRDLCLRAVGGVCRDPDQMNELDRLMDEATEAMLGSVAYASNFACSKRAELMNEHQKRSAFGRQAKSSPHVQAEVQRKVERTFADVGMAIFEALRVQASELDRIAVNAMQVIGGSSLRLTASKSEPVIASLACGALSSSQELWVADSPAACQTSGSGQDCTIDWDTFESDLKAMSSTVGNTCISDVALSTSATDVICASHDSTAMMLQLKEVEQEKADAIERARQAESSLQELERVHRKSLEKFSTFSNEDDILELQRALKEEQMMRVGLEVELREARSQARAAQDDSKAARFALSVAQQVAAKMACSGHRRNPSMESLGRSPSAEFTPPVHVADVAPCIALRPSMSMGDIPEVVNEPSAEATVPSPEADSAKRSDSAFILRTISLDNTVSPTSTTTAQVNEGDGESAYNGMTRSAALNVGMDGLTMGGTRETFGEGSQETSSVESPDSPGGVSPTEPFLLAPKMVAITSMPSGSLGDCKEPREPMGTDKGRSIHSPSKPDKAWNPFESQGAERAASDNDGDRGTPVDKGQVQDAVVSTQSRIPSGDIDKVVGAAAAHAREDSQDWNPFMMQTPSNTSSKSEGLETSEPSVKREEDVDSWNPFSVKENDGHELASGGVPAVEAPNGSAGDMSPMKGRESETWNPFSAPPLPVSPKERMSLGEWNPFAADPEGAATGGVSESSKDAVWNPFV